MFFETRIGMLQLGLLFRHGDFVRVLEPGRYRFFGRLTGRDAIEIVERESGRFEHYQLDLMLRDETFRAKVDVFEIANGDRGVTLVGGVVEDVLEPGRHVFLRGARERELVRLAGDAELVEEERLDALLGSPARRLFEVMEVPANHVGLLFIDGRLVRQVRSGRHVALANGRHVVMSIVDLRERSLDVPGQEILTADRVSLRVTAQADYRVVDVDRAQGEVVDVEQSVYRAVKLALRAAVGRRELDELLGAKAALAGELRDEVAPRAAGFGVEITALDVRDIVLPGDMKLLLNQVVEARKEAEANLIRRREETAATRSQLNTARLMAENPVLARMKELEELRKMLAGMDARFVFGEGPLLEKLGGLVKTGSGS